jgi:hypothetical protein
MFQINWFIDALALQSHHLGADGGCMLFFLPHNHWYQFL